MDKLAEIMEFIFMEFGQRAELRIGIWDEGEIPFTFYATIYDTTRDIVILGESTYGESDLGDALDTLMREVRNYEDNKNLNSN